MKKTQYVNTQQAFDEYINLILNQNKNKKTDYDNCIDTFKTTQLFNLENINTYNASFEVTEDRAIVHNAQFSIPYDSIFVKINEQLFLFLHDFDNFNITGCIFFKEFNCDIIPYLDNADYMDTKTIGIFSGTIPITIKNFLSEDSVMIHLDDNFNTLPYSCKRSVVSHILDVLLCLNELQKKTVFIDEPLIIKNRYYRCRNRHETVKVNNKPIYIVLSADKKAKNIKYDNIRHTGILRRDFCFSVCGHWRRLANNRHLGKDKTGQYIIQGYTWVNSFIKGDKNMPMVKREKIVL